jgi:hypothetical protein
MSVRTTADEKLDEVRTHLDEAYKSLIDFADKNTWGSDDYSPQFRMRAVEIASELYKLNNELE